MNIYPGALVKCNTTHRLGKVLWCERHNRYRVAFTDDIEYVMRRSGFEVLKNPEPTKAWETWVCPECKTIRPPMDLKTDAMVCALCGWVEGYDARSD